jgi:ABC-type antimicrobial peptide transport system permease subunit
MTSGTLIRRSLRFHARSHLGVVLGAAIGSTTLIGALIVGDSVKGSLMARAFNRLGPTYFAMSMGDRFFLANLRERLGDDTVSGNTSFGSSGTGYNELHYTVVNASPSSTALMLAGTAARSDGQARANHITILGVDAATWPRFARWRTGDAEPKTEFSRKGEARVCALSSTVLDQWRAGELVLMNDALARQLNSREGDEIILRIRKPSAITQDAVITPHEQSSIALRLKLGPVLSPKMLADFGLTASQVSPANAFLPLNVLAEKVELNGRANLFLYGPVLAKSTLGWWKEQQLKFGLWVQGWWRRGPYLGPRLSGLASSTQGAASLNDKIEHSWQLEDAQLSIHTNDQPQSVTGGEYILPCIEITSSRIFLEPPVIAAALTPRTRLLNDHVGFESDNTNDLAFCRFATNGVRILTYLANLIQTGDRATPYSMVTAADAPFVPRDMRIDEILINEWLAEDLHIRSGEKLDLVYYAVDSGSRLTERTNSFRVRAVVPVKGIYADRTLMPDFPGVAKAESTHEWDTGFPLVYKIRDKDETYWKRYRGTPKAFITLAAGQAMWASRFGSLTAIRYTVPANSFASTYREAIYRNLLANLDPADLGFRFQPVREQALKAANQAQDFGQLFLGFSLFLVVAALLLMTLLFQFSLEQRATEVGTFLALGFTPMQVRRLLLREGAALALLGGFLGAAGGIAYARAMLWGLATIWHSAVAGSELSFYASPVTLVIGLFSSTVIAVLTIWLALRRQARQPARELLAGEMAGPKRNKRSRAPWVALVSGLAAFVIISWLLITKDAANPGAFFGAGSLLLISGLALVATWLARLERLKLSAQLTLNGLGVRGCVRRRKRSLASIALLASGCFVIIAIGVFRLDANQDSARHTSGTGGFAYFGESTLPVIQDLNTAGGREFFGLSSNSLAGVEVVAFRVHDGDDASCLNLNRAQKPRLLGLKPDILLGRFTFSAVAKGLDRKKGWSLLDQTLGSGSSSLDEIPAIGDANSIEWALGKKIGDTLDYTDEYGHPFKLRLVGALANSILQGSLIIDEAQFVKRFPGESGYRVFLLDAPSSSESKLAGALSRALQDVGLELIPAAQRLNAFIAVQNTYLGTFQILGGLGLLLGSAGLGIVVLRNVLERRGELGLLLAVGFRKRQLHWLILSEHGALLGLGLSLGLLAAAVAVLPSLLSPASRLPYASLSLTLAAVCLNGVLWTWLATRSALSGNLLQALRNE